MALPAEPRAFPECNARPCRGFLSAALLRSILSIASHRKADRVRAVARDRNTRERCRPLHARRRTADACRFLESSRAKTTAQASLHRAPRAPAVSPWALETRWRAAGYGRTLFRYP